MKVLIWLGVVGLLAFTGVVNAEKTCVPAVDVADSLDVNASTDCDYEEAGLNGVVHKLFARDTAKPASSDSLPADHRRPEKPVAPVSQMESSFVANAMELAAARYQLLQKVSDQCPQGFRLLDERYSSQDKAIKIKFGYECLDD